MKSASLAMRRFVTLLALGAFLGIDHASAVVLDPISGVTAPSTLASSAAEGSSTFTVSDNTLQATGTSPLGASDSLGDSGFEAGSAADFGNFVTGNPGGFITYDLGGVYNVSDLLIWNFSQQGGDSHGDFNAAGVKEVAISTSLTGLPGSFTAVAGPNVDGTFTFNEVTQSVNYNTGPGDASPGTFNIPAQVLAVNLTDTQYVRLDLETNWGWTGGLIGLAEVNFVEAPEPSTFALLGLGLLGLIVWQRKRSAFRN